MCIRDRNKGGEEKFDEKKFKNPMFKVKYKGTLLDGTVFDDTKGNSVDLHLQVIPGFAEALTTLPVGSKWIVYIPSELAYGENTPGAPIEPNSCLLYTSGWRAWRCRNRWRRPSG